MNNILKNRNQQADEFIQTGLTSYKDPIMDDENYEKENFNPKSLKEIAEENSLKINFIPDNSAEDTTIVNKEPESLNDDYVDDASNNEEETAVVLDTNDEEETESFMSTNENFSFLAEGFNNMKLEGTTYENNETFPMLPEAFVNIDDSIKREVCDTTVNLDNNFDITMKSECNEEIPVKLEEIDNAVEPIEKQEIEAEFKIPQISGKRSFSTEQFQNAITYNFGESDFEFLQQVGTKPIPDAVIGRDSVLLKFDPLLEKVKPIDNISSSFAFPNKSALAARLSVTKEEEEEIQSDKNTSCEQQQELSVNASSVISPNSLPTLFTSLSNPSPLRETNNVEMKDLEIPEEIKFNETFEEIKESEKICNITNHQIEPSTSKTMTELESQLRKEAEVMEESLLKRISEKDKQIAKMNNVVEAYEKAIAELIAEKEQLIQSYDKKCTELKSDSETNSHHLASLESTFSDLHAKYERTKQIAAELKEREESILQDRKTLADNLKIQETRYEKMKMHAMAQLEIANNKLAEMSRNHQAEVTKLKAQLKKEEISRASINEQLVQKSKENAELVKICDELIGNHGHTQNA